MNPPDLYDHLEARDDGIPDGIYRVVGRREESVTLLRVGDPDERRVHTGEVVTVRLDRVDTLTASRNPDGNRPLGDALASKVEAGYWSLRTFVHQLAGNPLPTAGAVLLLLCGEFGDRMISLPDVAFGGFILAGSLALAYIGSGRL